ncbi:MAG: MBL fold metallo-hydrolase [Candidatus Rokubacteria bacterium]|nr:MBL fold metallo-hydrolase [Candidatus Rokubacteria bacterium]
MHVRFLGSGDAFGSGGRFQTCMHVRADGSEALIDCGTTSLVAMKRFGVDPAGIDLIALSHLHGDHFGGVPFFVLDAQFRKRARPLIVAGPIGTRERVRQAMEALFPGSSTVERRFVVEIVELTPGVEAKLGAFAVTGHEVVHASGAPPLALRLASAGKTVAYSGDTEWTPALLAVARDADLFVCEAYSWERELKYHLSARTVLAHRAELGCRRLILTHMSDEVLAHRAELGVETAEDGLTIAL